MGKLRFLFALWMAKLSVPALKITRHNGTDFPGTLALKLCPDFLKYVGRPKTIIAVTGTNGKTTGGHPGKGGSPGPHQPGRFQRGQRHRHRPAEGLQPGGPGEGL